VKSDVEKWLKEEGNAFLREMGIKRGQTILDFGCGRGHYAIPAAQVVGDGGKVYACEKDKEVLDILMDRVASEGFRNIERIDASGALKIPLLDGSCDAVLLFDILHYMDERRELLDEVHRVLKPDALLSVYPKHYKSDKPSGSLAKVSLEDIIKEIEASNFYLDRKYFGELLHDNHYNEGYVLNFKRR
jgi:ubiquinone/menaquinone biosynthesis C-methylase UbiE